MAYSAPFGLIGKPVDVHCTASLIGIFHQGERVASHPARRRPGRAAVTLDEHRPPQHRAAARLTPEAVRARRRAMGEALGSVGQDLPRRRSSRTGRAPGGRADRAWREVRRRCAADSRDRGPERQRAFLRLRPPMAGERPDEALEEPASRAGPHQCARLRLLPLTPRRETDAPPESGKAQTPASIRHGARARRPADSPIAASWTSLTSSPC